MSPMHDGFNGPQILERFDGTRGRGWFHRVLIWFFSRPDRRPW